MMRPEAVPAPDLVRFTIVPPESAPLDFIPLAHDLAISPDGTFVVYNGSGAADRGPGLNLRPIAEFDGAPLRGGEGYGWDHGVASDPLLERAHRQPHAWDVARGAR